MDGSFGELTQDPLEVGKASMRRPKVFKLWDISLQAPLVVKNCLPFPVAVTIGSGSGTVVSDTASEACFPTPLSFLPLSSLECLLDRRVLGYITRIPSTEVYLCSNCL